MAQHPADFVTRCNCNPPDRYLPAYRVIRVQPSQVIAIFFYFKQNYVFAFTGFGRPVSPGS